jgi:hypothetical protein
MVGELLTQYEIVNMPEALQKLDDRIKAARAVKGK